MLVYSIGKFYFTAWAHATRTCLSASASCALGLSVVRELRGWGIFGQHGYIEGTQVSVGVVPFQLSVGRTEVAAGRIDEVLAIGTEDRRTGVIPFLCDCYLLAGLQVIDIDHAHGVLGWSGVGYPLAVWRERHATELGLWALHQQFAGSTRDTQGNHPVLAVCIDQCLAIWAPEQATDIGVAVPGELFHLIGLQGEQIDFCLTGLVGDVGDVLAIRADGATALVCSRCTGQVLGHALIDWHVEHFATGCDSHPVPFLRNAEGSHVLAYILMLCTGIVAFCIHLDVNLHGLTGSWVEAEDVTTLLIDNEFAVCAGELHVIIGIVRQFLGLLCLRVIYKEVHGMVTV